MDGGMQSLLRYMVQVGASDLHVKALSYPGFLPRRFFFWPASF